MTRAQSPRYPNFSLREAVNRAKRAHEADRRNPIDRETAAKHIGYSGSSGAADKAIATMMHYGLFERVAKGEVRISQTAVDILHPNSPSGRASALWKAAFSPALFKTLRDRFPEGASESAIRSFLVRENFLDRAIGPAIAAYEDTCLFLKQENAFESGGHGDETGEESPAPEAGTVFGGAKPGDLIQWESGGALQLEKPRRVRAVSPDGLYVAIDGHGGSWVPMSEVIVETQGSMPPPPPPLKDEETRETAPLAKGEAEWMRNSLGAETKVRLLVTGEMGPREIGKLIKLLEAQRSVLTDDD